MPRLPDLFVVGAAKAGTTAVYHYFRAHPQIYVSATVKEANYMAYFGGLPTFKGPGDMTAGPGRSVTKFDDYLALFADRKHEAIAADISPAYLHRPQAAAKIAELCPDAKIVIILRNPIEAAFSMFSMMYRDGRETSDSFADAFHRSHQRLAAGWEWAWNYQTMFLYSEQVARYLDLFPRSQLFIRRYEELKFAPEKFYRDLTGFIGVDYLPQRDANPWVNTAARRWHTLRRTRRGRVLLEVIRAARRILPRGIYQRLHLDRLQEPAFRLTLEDRRMLAAHFREDVRELSTILRWNLDNWLRIDENATVHEPPASLPETVASRHRLGTKEVQKTA